MLTSLTIFGDTGFELTSASGNDKNSTISLGGTSDHVLDEVTMTWSIDNSDHVLGSLELPESDIDGDTTLALGLQLVQDPGIFEGALTQLSGFLFTLESVTGDTESRDASAPPPPNFLNDVDDKKRHRERETNLLELLDGTLVDTSALVDQVTCHIVSGLFLVSSKWRAYQ